MSDQFGRRDFLRAAAASGAAASLALAVPPSPKNLVEMLRLMRRIRHFEQRLTGLYKTYRFTSHAGAGQGQHNNPEELKKWVQRDPIAIFEKKLRDDGVMTAGDQDALKQQVLAEVEEAVAFAKKSAFPTFDEMPVTANTDLLA